MALALLGHQLQSVTPLGPGLQSVIARLQSLTHSDPAVGPLLVQLGAGGSTPTAASLVARVVFLSRLVAYLARTDPSAARRLEAALPALHTLLIDLLLAAHRGSPPTGWHPAWDSLAAGVARSPVALNSDATPAGVASAPQSFTQSPAPTLLPPTHRRSDAVRVGRPSTPALVGGVSPASAPLLAGGAVGSANAGIAAGAPAVALLAVLALWFLHTVLCGRVALDRVPWRSTQLGWRLERPG